MHGIFLLLKSNTGKGYENIPQWDEIPFLKDKKIVLRHAGLIDPESILDYIAVGGYKALAKALTTMQPTDIISEITQSKLRGRGGRLSNRKKWSIMYQAESDEKYIICNADEGDPVLT